MRQLFVILLFALSVPSWCADESVEFDYNKDTLSDKWFAGPALVYDCEEMHWACVAPFDHEKCQAIRQKALAQGKYTLDCAPAEVFVGKSECHAAMQKLIQEGMYPRVCIHPNERGRFIGFR